MPTIKSLFRSENISFYTRLLEGNYPDTDRLIPTDFNTTITFDVVNLRQSMGVLAFYQVATQNGTCEAWKLKVVLLAPMFILQKLVK